MDGLSETLYRYLADMRLGCLTTILTITIRLCDIESVFSSSVCLDDLFPGRFNFEALSPDVVPDTAVQHQDRTV